MALDFFHVLWYCGTLLSLLCKRCHVEEREGKGGKSLSKRYKINKHKPVSVDMPISKENHHCQWYS